jgi:Zn-dependent peptidase ImmA (M78 family)/DNA-binding XRE family transcriptional regulator
MSKQAFLETLGQTVREARERLGLSQQQLAEQVGLGSAQIVSQVELGRRDVKALELQRLAQALYLDTQELLAGKPVAASPTPLWRQQPREGRAETEARLRLLSHRFGLLRRLAGIESAHPLPPLRNVDVLQMTYDEIEGQATKMGEQLGLGSVPSQRLMDVLEADYDVLITYRDLGENGSAISVVSADGPAMLLNKREAPWRRVFSCAHELFHLLTWAEIPWDRIRQEEASFALMEKKAEAFASALLLPADTVRSAAGALIHEQQLDAAALVRLARQMGVSTSALLWRLVNLEVLPRDHASALLGDEGFRHLDRATMHAAWAPSPADLPRRYMECAVLAHVRGRLSRARLAELLEVGIADLEGFVESYGLSLELMPTYETQMVTTQLSYAPIPQPAVADV